jgi:hypothetical protein
MYDDLKRQVNDLQERFERYELAEVAEIVGIRISEAPMTQSVNLIYHGDALEIVLNDSLPMIEKRRWLFATLASFKST